MKRDRVLTPNTLMNRETLWVKRKKLWGGGKPVTKSHIFMIPLIGKNQNRYIHKTEGKDSGCCGLQGSGKRGALSNQYEISLCSDPSVLN